METLYCYLNGQIIPAIDAKISINDIGLLRGYAIFDFLRTKNGKPYLLEKHLQRFRASAEKLHLEIPLDNRKITNIINELLEINQFDQAGIRLFLSGGESLDGTHYNPQTPTFFITVNSLKIHPKEIYQKGIKLITYEYLRTKPEIKSTNYLLMLHLQPILQLKNAYDILYTWQGNILEGTTFNFFIFKGKELITPKDNILIGTRRNLIIKLAKGDFTISQRAIKISELSQATEAFISSTTRGIVPVVKINNRLINKGKIGDNTKKLMAKLSDHK